MALKVRIPHTHARVTYGTQQFSYNSSGGIVFAEEVEKDAPKKGLKLSTKPAYVKKSTWFLFAVCLIYVGSGLYYTHNNLQ